MPMEFINQNILLISIVVVSALGLIWPMFVKSAGNAVTPGEATLLINREDAHILDVRTVEEFAGGHLPEAKNIPMAKLADRIGELDSFKSKPIILCCASGARSNSACSLLQKQGFEKLYNLTGGVDAWVGAGYPIKKGTRNK